MEPKQTELTDALGVTSASLPGLLQDLGERRVPVGRFHRARILGASQVKIATKYLTGWLRTCYQGVDAKEQQRSETRLKAAVELLNSMAYMRGAVMKVGQLVANYPHLGPEEYTEALCPLHFEAPPMHYSLLREFVRNELGADPEDVFDEFETTAFAAASLGQVHRARLKGSRERVAIKIQYPSIGRTIRDDFRNLKALIFPLRLSGDWDNLKLQLEDVHSMAERETDYEQEAENLRIARSAFSDEDGIVIPKVYPEFSTKRVLTMEYIDGVHLRDFLRQNPTQEVRDRYGTKITLAATRLHHTSSMLYADPQPGNYYFMPDGRLGIVDFGCCHYFADDDLEYAAQAEALAQASKDTTKEVILYGIDARPGHSVDPEYLRLLEEFCDWLWKPARHDGAFDFGDPESLTRGVRLITEILRRRHWRSRPVNIWIERSHLGMRAMLHRLKARVDFGAILRQETAVTIPTPNPEVSNGTETD